LTIYKRTSFEKKKEMANFLTNNLCQSGSQQIECVTDTKDQPIDIVASQEAAHQENGIKLSNIFVENSTPPTSSSITQSQETRNLEINKVITDQSNMDNFQFQPTLQNCSNVTFNFYFK
jgi:hypothetical protein